MKRSFLILPFLALTTWVFPQSTSWTGAIDSTWHNPSNWTSGVPTEVVDVVIGDANFYGSFQPTVMASASCRALTISSGYKLNVHASDTVRVGGNVTNNGFIKGDSASFVFNGSNVTLCGTGTAVYKSLCVLPGVNFTINKNISINGNLVVDGSLTAVGKTISFVGPNPSIISGKGTITLGDLVMDKTNSFARLESPVTVTGNLNLASGVVFTSASGLLTLADNATSTNGSSSSYVDGPMEKLGNDVFVFPLGNNGVWARLLISAPALVTDGFVAQYFAAAYANTDSIALSSPVMVNVSKLEYWTCERSAGSSNVSVTLYWEDNTRSDLYDLNSVVVAHWNGSYWENEGQAGIIPLAQGNVTSVVQSSFSPFTFGSISYSNPMPIGLVDFSAKLDKNNHADLQWQTLTETNNKYFIVEKSADGLTFEAMTTVEGAGTSLVKHSYSYVDTDLFEGSTYYRLKQVDYNGNHTYSAVRMIQVNNDRTDIGVYPNPSNGRDFSVDLVKDAKISRIVLFNATGRLILEMVVANQELSRVDLMPANRLPAGVYTLLATGEGSQYKKKVMVQD